MRSVGAVWVCVCVCWQTGRRVAAAASCGKAAHCAHEPSAASASGGSPHISKSRPHGRSCLPSSDICASFLKNKFLANNTGQQDKCVKLNPGRERGKIHWDKGEIRCSIFCLNCSCFVIYIIVILVLREMRSASLGFLCDRAHAPAGSSRYLLLRYQELSI